MRLRSLTLTQYGPFDKQHIRLDPAPGRVNLVVAPNGAGKSVLRQSFAHLLFGIPGQTPLNFRYGYAGMRLQAEAEGAAGPLAFVRRKGQGNTLSAPDGTPLPAGALAGLIGGASAELLDRSFTLDGAGLRAGGNALLRAGGDLADALLQAAGGLREARALARALADRREEATPPGRRSSHRFVQALKQWTEAQKGMGQLVLTPTDLARREQERDRAQGRQTAANAALAEATRQVARLERVRRVRPCLAVLDAAEAWLREHAGAPVLPEDLAGRLAAAREAVSRAEDRLAAAEARRVRAEAALEAVAADPALLAEQARIEALRDAEGTARQGEADRPALLAERDAAWRQVAGILASLGRDLPPERAAEALPPRPVLREAERLLQERGRIEDRLERARRAEADLARQIAVLAAKAREAPAPAGTDELARLVRLARPEGSEPGPRLERLVRLARDRARDQEAAFALVPFRPDTMAALAALRPLPDAGYDALLDAAAEARRAAAVLQAALQAIEAERRPVRAVLDAMPGRHVPDATAVDHARRHRDAGWRLVRDHVSGRPAVPGVVAAWAGGPDLPAAYEQAVVAADSLADARAEAATQVAEAQAALHRLAELDTQYRAQEESLAVAQTAAERAAAAWRNACDALGVPVDTAGPQLREFLAARLRVLAAGREAARTDEELVAERQAQALLAGRLAGLLGAAAGTSLQEAVLAADTLLAAQAEADRAHMMAAANLLDREQNHARAAADLAEATRDHAAWRTAWEACLGALGRPAGEAPEITAEVLGLLQDLAGPIARAADLTDRIAAIAARSAGFHAAAAALGTTLGEQAADSFALARGLSARLQAALQAEARREELRSIGDACLREVAEAGAARHGATADLHAVQAASGARSAAEAEQRIAASAERRRHENLQAEAEAALLREGDGLPPALLRQEVATVPSDEAALQLDAACAAQEAASAAAQAGSAEASAAAATLEATSGAESAIAVAAEAESALATIGQSLEESLLAHIAATLLEQSMAAVAQGGDTQVQARIATWLRALTGGACADVRVQEGEDGTARLLVVDRDSPKEERGVAELSEGTRDQLFLALRLVAIEDYAATGPALPLVADDLLQTFDDARALATLRALATFSTTTQVIVLSHHDHLLGLAAQLPPGMVVVSRL